MPRSWYDRHANKLPEEHTEDDIIAREFDLSIVADKKPYFMRYIYPTLMNQYNTYIKNTKMKCLREFRMEISELMNIPESERTSEQNNFIRYYLSRMPVGIGDCVMNRICRIFENEFDGYLRTHSTDHTFDTSIMKSGCDYNSKQFHTVSQLYKQYRDNLRFYMQTNKDNRDAVEDEKFLYVSNLQRIFQEECLKICSNGMQLCDLVIDVCYKRVGTQQFAWDVCGGEIVSNLLKKNGYIVSYPVQDDAGDILYGGQRFRMARRRSVHDRDYFERESMGGECNCQE